MVKQIKNRLAQKTVRSVVKNKKNYMESVIFATSCNMDDEAVRINTNLVVNPICNARDQIDRVIGELKSEGHTILGFAYRTKGKAWELPAILENLSDDTDLIQQIKTKATYLGYNGLKAFSDLGPRVKYNSLEDWITDYYIRNPEMSQIFQNFYNAFVEHLVDNNPSIETDPDFKEYVEMLFVDNCKSELLSGLAGNLINILVTRKDLR